MESVVGIFTSGAVAERAAHGLRSMGVTPDEITLLVPGSSKAEIQSVPTEGTEGPGVGKALGGVVGGVVGAAAGMEVGAVTSFFLPGVGPVIAVGMIGAILLGAGGAIGGATAGAALDQSVTEGLPIDELFIYEDALRKGRTVLIVLTSDGAKAEKARHLLGEFGAENVDAAHESWWIGLRSDEELHYQAEGRHFQQDESTYRHGFEAALRPKIRGKSYEEAVGELRKHYPDIYRNQAFRRGFERGQSHDRSLTEAHKT